MNVKTITSAVIAAVLSFSLGMPAMALAGDRGHDRHGSGHSGGKRHKQDRHYKRHYKRHNKRHNKHYNKHYNKHHYGHSKRHYKGHRYPRYYGRGGYGNNYYYDYDNDDDYDELLFGLVTGGILGYALNQSQQNQRYDYPPAPNTYHQSGGNCLQEREYQTTVIVGGRAVDAYGTACLQPDGSWTRSPAVASY